MEVLWVSLVVAWLFIARNSIHKDVLLNIPLFASFCYIPLVILDFRFNILKLYPGNTTDLALQVLELNPGFDIEKWELISRRLNICFHQEQIWSTPYFFFFDGKQAEQVFKDNVIKLYLKGKFDDTTDRSQIESSKTYLKLVKETFDLYLKDDLPELPLGYKLPRESNRSRFFFNPVYLLLLFHVGSFEILSLVASIGLINEGLLGSLLLAISFHLTALLLYRRTYPVTLPLQSIIHESYFLAVITKVNPGQNLDKWDEIAEYMNRYLDSKANFDNSSLGFYDGRQCLGFYKTYFRPLAMGDRPSNYAYLKEVVQIVQPYVE